MSRFCQCWRQIFMQEACEHGCPDSANPGIAKRDLLGLKENRAHSTCVVYINHIHLRRVMSREGCQNNVGLCGGLL